MGKSLNQFLSQLNIGEAVSFKKENGTYSPTIHFDIQNKLSLIDPDAIFIYNNQPLILFFDLSGNTDTKREEDIHKKVWSFDYSPIAFVIKNREIKVYNALNYIKDKRRLEELHLTDEEITRKFSFWNIQSSGIWTWFQKEYIEPYKKKGIKKRVNERLFQNIKDIRNALADKENDPEGSIPNSLILRLIFIRYLIDRNINIDTRYITGDDIPARRYSFSNLIQEPDKLFELFAKLNDRFNGVLFKDVDIKLTHEQASALSDIFKGETPEKGTLFYGSDFYFEIFDFSIIPVEVISGIYESLIDPETRDLQSAVYTPSFLVEYILHDTIDAYLSQNDTSECKIFEVAVGSGIFLVQSLRRMIEKEIELHGNDDKKTFSERIRNIAKNNLFGIDINKEALKVTCFSIYIALLDYQEPKDINTCQFPNLLDENLFHANFFDTAHPFNQVINRTRPHYILGNPPWKSNKDRFHLEWLKSNKKTVGRFEIAQSFLLRTKDFMHSGTKAALIVTSTIFYNVSQTTRQFKKEFLTTYNIDKFFDLSPVRRLIFEEKDSPASIVYYQLSHNNDYLKNIIIHQSLKINYFLKYFKMILIEKYDQKSICQRYFLEYDWMFKVALYGNILDFNLLKKIQNNKKKIIDYIDNKTIFAGAGILKGTKDEYGPFTPILGKPVIENADIKRYFSYSQDPSGKIENDDIYIKSGRIKGLYEGRQILIKEQAKNESEIVISLADKEYVFRKGVFAISSTHSQDTIKKLYTYLITDLYQYYIYMTSGSWGTSTRPQIRWKEEFLSFPIIDAGEKESVTLASSIDRLIGQFKAGDTGFMQSEPRINREALDTINHTINHIYRINEYEKDLIDYVLKISRYQFQDSKQHLVTDFTFNNKSDYRYQKTVLEKYAEVYIREFQKIYPDEHIQVEIYPLKHFIAMNFIFSPKEATGKITYPQDKKNEAEVLEKIGNLSISQITDTADKAKNLFIRKDIKGFEQNSFYIIKPNEYKCWHRAMAWYDVAEFKAEIENAELDQLNM